MYLKLRSSLTRKFAVADTPSIVVSLTLGMPLRTS
jgi:hypothetical protein